MANPLINFKSDLKKYLSRMSGVMPVGHLWFGLDPKSKPVGVQLYSGQLLSRAAYPTHYSFVTINRTILTEEEWQAYVTTNGFCPYYSEGDGSTTYRMPLVKGVHPKFVSAMAEAGQHVEAGLPNITGTAIMYQSSGMPDASGAFKIEYRSTAGDFGDGSGVRWETFTIDASRSNPIYGNSDTVQPEAITMVVGEWVVGVSMPVGTSDAESLLASVTTLESNMGALQNGVGRASAYIVETWSEGTSWYRKWSDGWIEQGGHNSGSNNCATITFYAAMRNLNYHVQITRHVLSGNADDPVAISHQARGCTASSMQVRQTYSDKGLGTGASYAYDWKVCGYFA